ncbi:LytR C-terminal domain-containing protein [Streptomyces sp. AK02-01A]|uniref:LytR C-terminal domain-containing protein n=1 Tax=Streptomyces sp. AK02-01A TaxID=3028648 RepID=UPI0029BF1659|nr:LytR C-terminal domain-containing protein [Streptomyces sp. AK02-01A]MDX3854120.1 LytR C-terminal domain-containing protein [Streptomyces sp. AK02-01A]
MSMLTPPGMGGKYRITGDKYPRMRRPRHRRRIVLAAVAAVVALGLAGWGTLQLIDVFTGKGKNTTAGRTPDCDPSSAPAKALPKPGQITVNVYNATPRGGLAQSTADELKKRGFVIGKVGNAPAPYDKKVPGPGILLGATTAMDGPFSVLGTQLTGATPKTDARQTPDVDLIIGMAFQTLTVQKDADLALATLAQPVSDPACAETGAPETGAPVAGTPETGAPEKH